MENYFKDAELILSHLSVKSDCFEGENPRVKAKYLVCIDDDITSAFYAAYLYHRIYELYHYYPTVLCVGGVGPLSQYTNENGMSEGKKLENVCQRLGVRNTVVLDEGKNTGENLREIVFEVSKCPGTMVFCLTMRLSLRLKLTFDYLPHQYPEISNQLMKQMYNKGVYYYVPKQELKDQMKVYNAKGLYDGRDFKFRSVRGVLYLSEIASIYDRIERYSGTLQAPLGFSVPQEVADAAHRLAKKFRLKMPGMSLRKLWQFYHAYVAVKSYKDAIAESTETAIGLHHGKFEEIFNL